jgi:hypothetical protein
LRAKVSAKLADEGSLKSKTPRKPIGFRGVFVRAAFSAPVRERRYLKVALLGLSALA